MKRLPRSQKQIDVCRVKRAAASSRIVQAAVLVRFATIPTPDVQDLNVARFVRLPKREDRGAGSRVRVLQASSDNNLDLRTGTKARRGKEFQRGAQTIALGARTVTAGHTARSGSAAGDIVLPKPIAAPTIKLGDVRRVAMPVPCMPGFSRHHLVGSKIPAPRSLQDPGPSIRDIRERRDSVLLRRFVVQRPVVRVAVDRLDAFEPSLQVSCCVASNVFENTAGLVEI